MVGTKLVALGYVVLLSIGLANAARVVRFGSGSATGTGAGGGGSNGGRGVGGAGPAARKCPSRQILLRIGAELGSASHPVNLKVEGELLPRPAKTFTGRTRLRGLFG